MDPIRPIGPREPEVRPVEGAAGHRRISREDREEAERRERERRERERREQAALEQQPPPSEEDEGGHVDVRV
jgi:hypothetical protein